MILKNVVTISLMIFIIAIVAILGIAVFQPQKTINSSTSQNTKLSINPSTNTETQTRITPSNTSAHPNPVINQGSVNGDNEGDREDDGSAIAVPPSNGTTPTPMPVPAPTPTSSGITLAQVVTHNSANDCWVVISGNVYDVTNYIPIHPGGPGQIIPYCGKDATIAFDTKGGRGSHSTNAQNILTQYYVGVLTR